MKSLIIISALMMSLVAQADNKSVLDCSYKYAALQVSEGPNGEVYIEASALDRKGGLYSDPASGKMLLKGIGSKENTVILTEAKVDWKSEAGILISLNDSEKSVVTLAIGKTVDGFEVKMDSNNKKLKKSLVAARIRQLHQGKFLRFGFVLSLSIRQLPGVISGINESGKMAVEVTKSCNIVCNYCIIFLTRIIIIPQTAREKEALHYKIISEQLRLKTGIVF